MSLATIADALSSQPPNASLAWGIVSAVQVGRTTTNIFFSLYGAPTLDAVSGTNIKLARVGTLNPGDKVLLAKLGGGGWVVMDRIRTADDLEA